MAALYAAGVRGATLTAITAWKEILLAVALLRVVRMRCARGGSRSGPGGRLAGGRLRGCSPSSTCSSRSRRSAGRRDAHGGRARAPARRRFPSARTSSAARSCCGRDDLRRLALDTARRRRLRRGARTCRRLCRLDRLVAHERRRRLLPPAPRLRLPRHRGEPGVAGLPENFIYNVGGDKPFLRRLVSTFLSPLASSYLFVVALLVAAAALRRSARRRRCSSVVACRGAALDVLARVAHRARGRDRRARGGAAASGRLAAAVLVVARRVRVGAPLPEDRADRDLDEGRPRLPARARAHAGGRSGLQRRRASSEPSLHSHWVSLREGVRTVVHHPQGYGLGNVGPDRIAHGRQTPIKAGESNYTELGVELGVLGAVLWTRGGSRCSSRSSRAGGDEPWAAGLAAAFAAVLVLAVQTDVIGDPWVAYCVWGLAGALVLRTGAARASCDAAARVVPSVVRCRPRLLSALRRWRCSSRARAPPRASGTPAAGATARDPVRTPGVSTPT